jgi:hypothetical protein
MLQLYKTRNFYDFKAFVKFEQHKSPRNYILFSKTQYNVFMATA